MVQEYNTSLKHEELTGNIKWPDDVTFVKKTRHLDVKKHVEKSTNAKQTSPWKKRISFHIGDTQEPCDEEN